MPDLNIHSYYACKSCEFWNMEHPKYRVVFEAQPSSCYFEYDYSCDCPAKKFNPHKNCKHINEAIANHCQWNQHLNGGEPIDGKCPNCGEETITMRIAV